MVQLLVILCGETKAKKGLISSSFILALKKKSEGSKINDQEIINRTSASSIGWNNVGRRDLRKRGLEGADPVVIVEKLKGILVVRKTNSVGENSNLFPYTSVKTSGKRCTCMGSVRAFG